MPLYEYRCGSCGNGFEVRQSFSDAPGAACPKCEGASQRVLQAVGIVFKGSGWHSTDYRSNRSGSTNGTGSSSESSSSSETKSDTKTESKPESKTETKGESNTKTASKGN